ncbi:MAG: hypothetical protein AMS24_00075 [Chlamydiae bacterium SM23_39]|nr:MAG: hypothetical protein AMS24_00075 [Chlamydiae bacterium SM23_39]
MVKLLKKSKLFVFFLIFTNVSFLIASTPIYPSATQSQSYFANKGNIMKQLYNEDGLLVYDLVIKLLEELENGLLEDVCTEQDLYEISYFLALLARSGTLSNATEEEKAELERDIQELLSPYEDDATFENSSYRTGDYQIIPAVYYRQYDIILCKNWFKKKFKKVRKYIKKHKKAFIIGSALVVGTIAVVATIAIAKSTKAAEATTPESCTSKSKKEENLSSNPIPSPENSSSNSQDLTLYQSFNDQISEYKDTIVENNLHISDPKDQNYIKTNNERIIGSTLAHNAIENIPKYILLETYEQIINQGHGQVDNVFATNQASLYMDKNDNSNQNFQENFFRIQGEQALNNKHYDKAIDNFGKAIANNPNNHNIYLDRAYAFLQDGQFEHSLNDYQVYIREDQINTEKSITFVDCFDFSVGTTTGIAKGAVESGKQLISFAANAITHPVDTGRGIYVSFSNIAKLAYSQEWKELSKILAPEVCELINIWESLYPKEKGERSGYIVGKYGADILIPGATAKAISKGIKGAKELAILAKNLQRTERVVILEALAGIGGSGNFAETVCAWKTAEKIMPHSSGILKNIKVFSSITTKSDLVNIIKPNGKWIGKAGTKPYIRLFEGSQKESIKIFNKLTKNAKLINDNSYSGKMYLLQDGTVIGFRPLSKSGAPTIDIKLPDIKDNIKLKFLEKN